MPRRVTTMRFDPELLVRVDAEAGRLGQTRTVFIERALEASLDQAPSLLESQVRAVKAVERDPSLADDLRYGPKVDQAKVTEAVKSELLAARNSDVKSCGYGCVVPAGSKLKRCVPHSQILK